MFAGETQADVLMETYLTRTIKEYKDIGDAVNVLLDRLESIDGSRDEFVSNGPFC